MPIRVLVNGANGKMGQEVVKAIQQDKELNLAGTAGKNDNLAEKIKSTQAQVVVDFTVAGSGFKNTQTIIEAGAHPVIGTTGFSLEQIDALQKIAATKKLGGIVAPNFSPGAVLMMQFSETAARYFPHVEIIEMHHDGKKDAPSGTSRKTADMIADVLNKKSSAIPIHSVRLPGLVAHQLVVFGGHGETLTIRHDSVNRECFMPGVILACKKVVLLKELVYGLEKILR